jgi:lysophospholipase L1-like esterase
MALAFLTAALQAASVAVPGFRTNDVVVLVGGSILVAENTSGILETALQLAHPGAGLRVRNLAKEGDTVFLRPRDVNYPDVPEQARRASASVIVVQYGRSEALSGPARPAEFRAAYASMLDELARITPRLMLMTPPPFESTAPPLPNVARRNPVLESYAGVIRDLARERGLPLIDLNQSVRPAGMGQSRRTLDGVQLSVAGERAVAAAVLRSLGRDSLAGAVDASEGGVWSDPKVRELQSAVVEKNRLWFGYVRPTNWAFLAGDRTEQLSSRDHRDPKIRWFPAEMEQFVPLISAADQTIASRIPAPGQLPSLQ